MIRHFFLLKQIVLAFCGHSVDHKLLQRGACKGSGLLHHSRIYNGKDREVRAGGRTWGGASQVEVGHRQGHRQERTGNRLDIEQKTDRAGGQGSQIGVGNLQLKATCIIKYIIRSTCSFQNCPA